MEHKALIFMALNCEMWPGYVEWFGLTCETHTCSHSQHFHCQADKVVYYKCVMIKKNKDSVRQ